MGCTGSKNGPPAGRGGGVRGRSPYARCYSGPITGGVRHHTVALKSSTLGSLNLERAAAAALAAGDEEMMKARNDDGGTVAPKPPPPRQSRFLPRTPTKTPLHEPEVINVWELMQGLGDDDDDEGPGIAASALARSFSFCGGSGADMKRQTKSAPGSPEFDPDILAAFREALGEQSPPHGVPRNGECIQKREIPRFPGIVRARVSAFQRKIDAKLAKMPPPQPVIAWPPPESARRVVLYLTTLRGIRKTYEDCCATKAILHGYGVRVDERDLSMHCRYKDELRAALGSAGFGGKLPQVFTDGKYLGGADEVRSMHEAGELGRALEVCEMAPGKGGGGGGAPPLQPCGGCGGVRFVPCGACSGSCKVFVEDGGGGAGGFRRCPGCNENGLVNCPLCCQLG